MENNSTIFETFTLPSKGLVYDGGGIDPKITLRPMKTIEEMERLSPTEAPYKVMSDIIEKCMKVPPKVHVYDMILGDYQFLLHKIRIVTYGKKYKFSVMCPNCEQYIDAETDLEELEVNEYDASIDNLKRITLPQSNDLVTLRFQTPRDLDNISFKKKERQKKTKSLKDYGLLFTLISVIDEINGRKLDDFEKEEYVKNLYMGDVNYILRASEKLNASIGLGNYVTTKCPSCNYEFVTPFRITPEFFGPTID